MTPKDITYCSASNDGRCVNHECRRFLTKSMAAAAARDGDRLSWGDLWDECVKRRAPRGAAK